MADRIVGEYAIKVDEAVKNLNALSQRVGKLEKDTEKAAQGTEEAYSKMTSNLMGQFKNLAGVIGIAFSAQQVISLGKEMVTLAAQAEGVERAFKRVGSPQLLDDLRKATRGTVSDLQLMQNAVKASNFKIPLENLASLFRFAQARARETGESVDYLVDSIILGIGRKSPLILDNLGISAVELRTRLKGVGVEAANVGEIAQIIGGIADEELKKAGDQADTTADKIAQISTKWENLKIQIGDSIAIEKAIMGIGDAISYLSNEIERAAEIEAIRNSTIENTFPAIKRMNEATRESTSILEQLKSGQITVIKAINELDNGFRKVADAQAMASLSGEENKAQFEAALKIWREAIKTAREYGDTLISDTVEPLGDTIDAIDKAISKLKELNTSQTISIITITSLGEQLKKLKTDLDNAAVGSKAFFDIVDKVDAKTKELNEALAMTKINEALKVDEEPLANVSDEVVNFGSNLENVFGEEGSKRIQEYWDMYVNDALAAMDAVSEHQEMSLNDQIQVVGQYVGAFSSAMRSLSALQSSLYDQELSALEMRFANEQISREQYEQERKEILRQQAIDQKTFATFDAAVNGALAIINAYSEGGPVLAAIVAAAVAAEVATIASQPLPQFAEGGFVNEHGQLKGRKHSQGGIKIEAEGGEFITAAKYAQPNAEILRAINTGNWEKYKVENIIAPAIQEVLKGGFEGLAGSYQLNSIFNDKNILKTLDRNRQSERDGFVFLANEITKNLKGRRRGGFN